MMADVTNVSEGLPRDGDPYLVVSTDSHVGPSLERDLRPYCPPGHLDDFDAFAEKVGEETRAFVELFERKLREAVDGPPSGRKVGLQAWARTKACAGQTDPGVHLADMDASGIVAEVIFAGGENDDVLPFADNGFSGAGPADVPGELRHVGWHIFNEWLADFVSVAPERLLGVMQIPIWDVDAAVREMTWGRDAGLRAVNLPAPRWDFADYTDPCYEPLWDASEDLGLPLLTHAAGGEAPIGGRGRFGPLMSLSEGHWLARRGLWELILSGVFERHPNLKFVITEQRLSWVGETLNHLDSVYRAVLGVEEADPTVVPPLRMLLLDDFSLAATLSRKPSEYWASNCFVSGSTLAPHEIDQRYDVGVGNLMWGSDYPHMEGTWPDTALSIRHAFAGVPEHETRRILGETAVDVYHLDVPTLTPIAQRIGPKPGDIVPLLDSEFPEIRSYAFRRHGPFD